MRRKAPVGCKTSWNPWQSSPTSTPPHRRFSCTKVRRYCYTRARMATLLKESRFILFINARIKRTPLALAREAWLKKLDIHLGHSFNQTVVARLASSRCKAVRADHRTSVPEPRWRRQTLTSIRQHHHRRQPNVPGSVLQRRSIPCNRPRREEQQLNLCRMGAELQHCSCRRTMNRTERSNTGHNMNCRHFPMDPCHSLQKLLPKEATEG
jgi:hypothetical protein